MTAADPVEDIDLEQLWTNDEDWEACNTWYVPATSSNLCGRPAAWYLVLPCGCPPCGNYACHQHKRQVDVLVTTWGASCVQCKRVIRSVRWTPL